VSRRSRLEWILAALLLVGLTAAVVAEAGTRKGAVASQIRSAVSVIDTATNSLVVKAIEIGRYPEQIAITPDGSRVYVVKN
jgi:YVTN family beta-propeller protein